MNSNTISDNTQELTQEQEQKLHALGIAYIKADITRIQAQRECECIMAQLMEILRDPEGATYTDDDLHITIIYVPEIVKQITDTPRLRAEYPELWETYTKESIVKERIQVQANA